MPRLVYVMAASHSGSTLLAMLLNAHPQVVTAGELKAVNLGDPERYRCSCHALLKSCDFWQAVNREMVASGHDFRIHDLARTHFDVFRSTWIQRLLRPLVRAQAWERLRELALTLSPEWRHGLPIMLQRSRDLVHAVARVAGAEVVVESSKVGMRLKMLAEHTDLDIHVVRLIRDGRAVALTYMRPAEFADAKDASLRGGGTGANHDHTLDMAASAREWRRSNEEAEALLAQLPGLPVIQLNYETLCSDPLQEVNRVFAALGLSPIATLDGFRDVPHHVIGNGMRLDTDSRIVLDDRWRQTLSEDELHTFAAVAGGLNRSYGYV
ncbi:MAG: sulfotransferase [Pseudomonadales bacterium]